MTSQGGNRSGRGYGTDQEPGKRTQGGDGSGVPCRGFALDGLQQQRVDEPADAKQRAGRPGRELCWKRSSTSW